MPTTISLTPQQEAAVGAIASWWLHRRGVFCLAGYAGTGKSTVVNHVVAELGVPRSRVAYLTPTWKAALVLQAKGLPARTIHSLIYGVEDGPRGPVFTRREELPEPYDLFVVDEWSMVGTDVEEDLMAFGIPILALGDPEQIPPVDIPSSGRLKRPDAFLTEIHRQAADNPILWASMLAREGKPIPLGLHGAGQLEVVPARAIWREEIDLLSVDQIICCTNRTRCDMNQSVRRLRGFSGTLPQQGERLLSFQNVKQAISSSSYTPLVNGLQGTVTAEPWDVDLEAETAQLSFALDEVGADVYSGVPVDLCRFTRPSADSYNPKSLPGNGRRAQFDFGYAMTAHKSQGSEYPRVLVIATDLFGDADDRRRLLYTAITRASEHLTLAVSAR